MDENEVQQELQSEAAEPEAKETAPEIDWKAESRKWEKRARNADKAERELAKATERAEAAERKLAAREAADKHAAMVRSIADKYRIDQKYAPLLTADDEEGLIAQAKLIGDRFAEPVEADTGKQPASGKGSAEADMRSFASQFFGE